MAIKPLLVIGFLDFTDYRQIMLGVCFVIFIAMVIGSQFYRIKGKKLSTQDKEAAYNGVIEDLLEGAERFIHNIFNYRKLEKTRLHFSRQNANNQ